MRIEWHCADRRFPGGKVRALRAIRRAGFDGTVRVFCGRQDSPSLDLLGMFDPPSTISLFASRCSHSKARRGHSSKEDFFTVLHELGHYRRFVTGKYLPGTYSSRTEAASDPEERAADRYAKKEFKCLTGQEYKATARIS